MRVIHISSENFYGAGRAAYRICEALNSIGVESKLYVLKGDKKKDTIIDTNTKQQRVFRYLANQLNRNRLSVSYHAEKYSVLSKELINLCNNADIIHLHWVNNGIWSDKFIKLLIKVNKPIVWTLHDMWAFTGGCHYTEKCTNYKLKCIDCPYEARGVEKSIPKKELLRKKKFYNRLNISFVGCSQWITNEMNESYIGKSITSECICIPNPLDDTNYHHIDKEIARKILGISTSKKIVLFGAAFNSDSRKGFSYLEKAITFLDKNKYCIGVFGGDIPNEFYEDYEKISFGYISDDLHLALVYSSADVYVAPSIQENLANTVMESLGCGTPVVAFDIGGMPDMIEPHVNGVLVKPFSVLELAEGIKKAADLKNRNIGLNTSLKFAKNLIAEKYLKLYKHKIEEVNK